MDFLIKIRVYFFTQHLKSFCSRSITNEKLKWVSVFTVLAFRLKLNLAFHWTQSHEPRSFWERRCDIVINDTRGEGKCFEPFKNDDQTHTASLLYKWTNIFVVNEQDPRAVESSIAESTSWSYIHFLSLLSYLWSCFFVGVVLRINFHCRLQKENEKQKRRERVENGR